VKKSKYILSEIKNKKIYGSDIFCCAYGNINREILEIVWNVKKVLCMHLE
jgi:hypothetical protein